MWDYDIRLIAPYLERFDLISNYYYHLTFVSETRPSTYLIMDLSAELYQSQSRGLKAAVKQYCTKDSKRSSYTYDRGGEAGTDVLCELQRDVLPPIKLDLSDMQYG
jgi:hypothetical protein